MSAKCLRYKCIMYSTKDHMVPIRHFSACCSSLGFHHFFFFTFPIFVTFVMLSLSTLLFVFCVFCCSVRTFSHTLMDCRS